MWPKFPYNYLRVEENLRAQTRNKPGKSLNQDTEPTWDRTRAHCVQGKDVTPKP